MAKLYYKYGAMKSGKSSELWRIADTYARQGKRTLILTPSIDNRHGVGKITSRLGLTAEAYSITDSDDVFEALRVASKENDIHCILVDEVQFLSREVIIALKQITLYQDIPVIGFGLKNDFANQLFEGAAAMLVFAESIEEVKTTCTYCSSKATMNLRKVNGKPVYEGEQIQVGDEEYEPVCCYHYYHNAEID